jgi:hypothetical protein
VARSSAGTRVSTERERLLREVERVADRLRVIGPRLAARGGPDAARALDGVRQVLQRLADLAADAEDRPLRTVPVLGAHALGDQVLVLGHDVAGSGDSAAMTAAEAILVTLRRSI